MALDKLLGGGQVPRIILTVDVVTDTTVDSEVGSLVDERPHFGIHTSVGGTPEGTAEVYRSELVGICSRDHR